MARARPKRSRGGLPPDETRKRRASTGSEGSECEGAARDGSPSSSSFAPPGDDGSDSESGDGGEKEGWLVDELPCGDDEEAPDAYRAAGIGVDPASASQADALPSTVEAAAARAISRIAADGLFPQGSDWVRVHLTGFREYAACPDANPSRIVAREVGARLAAAGATMQCDEIDVNAVAVARWVEAESRRPRAGSAAALYVHLGVCPGETDVRVETRAFNAFRPLRPAGGDAAAGAVDASLPLHAAAASPVAVPALARGPGRVALSADPARFHCNALYFLSLTRLAGGDPRSLPLFVHLPPAADMPLAAQCAAVEAVVGRARSEARRLLAAAHASVRGGGLVLAPRARLAVLAEGAGVPQRVRGMAWAPRARAPLLSAGSSAGPPALWVGAERVPLPAPADADGVAVCPRTGRGVALLRGGGALVFRVREPAPAGDAGAACRPVLCDVRRVAFPCDARSGARRGLVLLPPAASAGRAAAPLLALSDGSSRISLHSPDPPFSRVGRVRVARDASGHPVEGLSALAVALPPDRLRGQPGAHPLVCATRAGSAELCALHPASWRVVGVVDCASLLPTAASGERPRRHALSAPLGTERGTVLVAAEAWPALRELRLDPEWFVCPAKV